MKFKELPIGAKFRFHRRGLEHTKTSEDQFPPELEVVYQEPGAPAPSAREAPFARFNRVDMVKGGVLLNGTFTADQLEAVLAALKKTKTS